MRMQARPDGPIERLALRLNLAPLPGAYAMYGMTAGRAIGVGQKLGLYEALLAAAATPDELATRLTLQPVGVRLLCEVLEGLGVLRRRTSPADDDNGRFTLARRAVKWLDPASQTYIGTWIEHTTTYWEWYGDLERVVRDGGSFEIHAHGMEAEDYWRVYITGQYELARLSAAEVAKAIKLDAPTPSALLDVAGAHGWFSAAVCERHPGLSATVVDLPGSARVGRAIIAAAGMAERVRHVEGDMFTSALGGPYDVALVFDIVHHLSAERTLELLRRVRASLRPGGTIAILDMFRSPRASTQTASASALGLFFHLTSGADIPNPAVLAEQLVAAGFERPKRTRIRRIPDQDLYQARAASP